MRRLCRKPPDCLKFWVMADGNGEPGPETDDEFDRQLRALTEGSAGAAKFRELSAAERAKAAARQAKQSRKLAGRNATAAKRAARRTAKRERRTGTGSRHGRLSGFVALAVILAVSGGYAWVRVSHPFAGGPDDTQTVRNGAVPSASGTRSSPSPTPTAVLSGPPADPFENRPADHWADGAAGIVIPAARPVGKFTAAQVAQAYQTTKKLLIAANLDQQTLLGGAPNAFADLLTRQQRTEFVSDLNKTGVDSHDAPLSTRAWVVSFAPGTTALIGSVIKVHGTMTAQATAVAGRKVLAIDINYRFVYPVEPPRAPADWMRVIGQVSGSVEFGDWAQARTSFEPFDEFNESMAGDRCDVSDGFVHPDYPNSPADKVQASGPAIDPYSMATPKRVSGCQAASRT